VIVNALPNPRRVVHASAFVRAVCGTALGNVRSVAHGVQNGSVRNAQGAAEAMSAARRQREQAYAALVRAPVRPARALGESAQRREVASWGARDE